MLSAKEMRNRTTAARESVNSIAPYMQWLAGKCEIASAGGKEQFVFPPEMGQKRLPSLEQRLGINTALNGLGYFIQWYSDFGGVIKW